jgi:transcription elongation factor Elf1
LNCEYCFGTVKVVDSFHSVQTVECLRCGVRYDVRINPKMSSEGVGKVFIKTENEIYNGLDIFIKEKME